MNTVVGNVTISLDTGGLEQKKREMQKLLNESVVARSDKYIPFQQGALRGSVSYPEGIYGGTIEYNTPYAHYQWEGEKYGPNIPMFDAGGNLTGFFSPPVKFPTGEPLKYHEPGTGDHWTEKMKQNEMDLVIADVSKAWK